MSKLYHLKEGGVTLLSWILHIFGFSFLFEEDSSGRVKIEISPESRQVFADFSFPCEIEGCEGLVFRLNIRCGQIRSESVAILPQPVASPVSCEKCNQLCSLERVDEINAAIREEVVWEAASQELNAMEERV